MNYLKYFNILLKAKINRKLQMRYIRIPEGRKSVTIDSFGELYLSEFFDELWIEIDKYMADEKEILLRIIINLAKKNKKIWLIQKVRVFTDEDIKHLYNVSRKITLYDRYIDKSKSLAANQILMCDISSYILIIEKLDYFEKICNKYFKTDLDKIIFSIIQLVDYAEYSKENTDATSCLTNIFLLKTGVCIDISIALYKMLERLEVECLIIKGISDDDIEGKEKMFYNHAWNQVKCNNRWYNVDATWFQSEKKLVKYLLSGDDVFYADGKHTSRFKKERCFASISQDDIVERIEEIRKYKNIFEEYDKGERKIELKRKNIEI